MVKENFKDIVGFEGLYKVSDQGNVIRFINGKWRKVKPWPNGRQYLEVSLSKNGKRRVCLLHRLVAIAFLPIDVYRTQVNHINEDKSDNRASNLEWVTPSENNSHGSRNERISINAVHERHFIYVKLDDDGNELKRYYCKKELDYDGFNVKAISTACRHGWRHGGYKWLKLKIK